MVQSASVNFREIKKRMNHIFTVIVIAVCCDCSLENGNTRLCLNCTEKSVPRVMDFLNEYEDIRSSVEIFKSEKVSHDGTCQSPMFIVMLKDRY